MLSVQAFCSCSQDFEAAAAITYLALFTSIKGGNPQAAPGSLGTTAPRSRGLPSFTPHDHTCAHSPGQAVAK